MLFISRKCDPSQTIRGNMIFFVYLVEMVFLFPTNMILTFFQKSKNEKNAPEKNAFRDEMSGIINDDIYPRQYGISSDKKVKDDKKFL